MNPADAINTKDFGNSLNSNTDKRPDKVSRIMIELEVMAQWSTCQRLRTASALANHDFVIVVPARNGTPYGMPKCEELTTPDERCKFCVHAERNAINHAARLGVRTEGLNLFSLYRPCLDCANSIVQAGIAAVYYRWDYNTDVLQNYVFAMFNQLNIHIEQIEMAEQERSFRDMLKDWRRTWDR